MGDVAAIVFNLDGAGEISIRIPFEAIADTQIALAHVQRSLILKRQALGAAEEPNLLFVKSVRALDLPDKQLHLQINTENGIPFHFHLSENLARSFATALNSWLERR